MTSCRTHLLAGACLASLLLADTASAAQTPSPPPPPPPSNGPDSVVIQASRKYGASGFHRFMLGDTYRDLWAAPIKVPVLDMATYAGGLRGEEEGGNAQTRNLHLRGADGKEYVFRPIFKEILNLPDEFDGTVIADIFADGLSASHPAATVIPSPFLEAAGLIHPRPVLYVMPDDPRLGEFREHFAGMLGTMEEFPEDPDEGRGFRGAVDIIDSEDLLEKLNEEPGTRIDAQALLTARLVDMLIGDNDRHPGQWKWARMRESDEARWIPIPRDRDKAFVSYEGALVKMARITLPRLISYGGQNPSPLFRTATAFDRRLLVSLDREAFDSTAHALQRAVTDSVIAEAMSLMPPRYRAEKPDLEDRIRSRRDDLVRAAGRYYDALFSVADVHGTAAPERAEITRHADGSVEVRLSAGGQAFLERRFAPGSARAIRIYLHDGDDTVATKGSGSGPGVWIVGGPGRNTLLDGRAPVIGSTRVYDFVHAGAAPPDEDAREEAGYDPDTAWNPRPMVQVSGEPMPPFRDHGSSIGPIVGLSTGRGLGVVPSIGISRKAYGFRQYPYASRVDLEVAYSTEIAGWEVELMTDNRFESSPLFFTTEAEMSQLKTGRFAGFGNDALLPSDEVILDVRQKQWLLRPAVGWALSPMTELTIGPLLRYTTTDSVPETLVTQLRPYGFTHFGQVGIEARLTHEFPRSRDGDITDQIVEADPKHRLTLEADAAYYPTGWSAESPYGSIGAVATGHLTIPTLMRPILAARVGGRRVFGDFPYFDAAFLGGRESVRTIRRQRYAGDAAVHGSLELRIPVAEFPLVFPLSTGVLGFVDAGRVYLDGDSPGGWHTGAGGGIWVGLLNPSTSLTLTWTNSRDRRMLLGTGFAF